METTENTATASNLGKPATFTAADAHAAFGPEFLDDGFCRDWVLRRLHPAGVFCPGCGAAIVGDNRLQRFWSGLRLTCPACGKFFTALTGTFLARSQQSFRELVLLAFLLEAGFSNTETARLVRNHPNTVRMWRLKFETLKEVESLIHAH